MLGNIAKKLRLLGFDSEYSSDISDEEILLKAKNENRIIITKDGLLTKLAQKQKIPIIELTTTSELEQLSQIFQNLNLKKFVIDGKTTRCSVCNGHLSLIDKDKILNQVPPSVLEKIENFWKCGVCSKIYWEGTHIDRLQKFVVELNEKL